MNHDKLKRKTSHDLVVHVEICLILYVLDSRDGHFGNMLIKKMPPPLLNVIIFWRFLPDYICLFEDHLWSRNKISIYGKTAREIQ